jgi:hypothetical protein
MIHAVASQRHKREPIDLQLPTDSLPTLIHTSLPRCGEQEQMRSRGVQLRGWIRQQYCSDYCSEAMRQVKSSTSATVYTLRAR